MLLKRLSARGKHLRSESKTSQYSFSGTHIRSRQPWEKSHQRRTALLARNHRRRISNGLNYSASKAVRDDLKRAGREYFDKYLIGSEVARASGRLDPSRADRIADKLTTFRAQLLESSKDQVALRAVLGKVRNLQVKGDLAGRGHALRRVRLRLMRDINNVISPTKKKAVSTSEKTFRDAREFDSAVSTSLTGLAQQMESLRTRNIDASAVDFSSIKGRFCDLVTGLGFSRDLVGPKSSPLRVWFREIRGQYHRYESDLRQLVTLRLDELELKITKLNTGKLAFSDVDYQVEVSDRFSLFLGAQLREEVQSAGVRMTQEKARYQVLQQRYLDLAPQLRNGEAMSLKLTKAAAKVARQRREMVGKVKEAISHEDFRLTQDGFESFPLFLRRLGVSPKELGPTLRASCKRRYASKQETLKGKFSGFFELIAKRDNILSALDILNASLDVLEQKLSGSQSRALRQSMYSPAKSPKFGAVMNKLDYEAGLSHQVMAVKEKIRGCRVKIDGYNAEISEYLADQNGDDTAPVANMQVEYL